MAKDTYSSQISFAKPLFTPTVFRSTIWNAAIMTALYLLFNFFTFFTVNYFLEQNLDVRIRHEIEHINSAFDLENDSLIILNPKEFEESDLAQLTEDPFFLQVYSLSGEKYLESKNLKLYQPIPLTFPEFDTQYYFEDLTVKDDNLRTGYFKLHDLNNSHNALIQLSVFKSASYALTNNIIFFNFLTFPLILIIIVMVSIFLAKKNFVRINRIIDKAKKITATNLNERFEYQANPNDEIERLKSTLNNLFERLENQVKEISNFSDNASHQLMTPLTVLNTELDYILKQERNSDEYAETLNIFKEQTHKMINIVNTLLILSKDCRDCNDKSSVFNISKAVNEETEHYLSKRDITTEIENDIYVRGKKEYFALVVNNLIDNAVKYSEDGSEVQLKLMNKNREVEFEVIDQGIGIPKEEKERIFNRFYRGKNTELNGIGGNGLGLALVNSIVNSMNGRIEIVDNKPRGTTFKITLPQIKLN